MNQTANPLLDEALIAKIKKIQFRAKHLVSETFAGEYASAFRGRGMEFDEIRQYTVGDDVRSIDWNVTARTGDPHVKVFRDERELTVLFVVDVSASMQFGHADRFKIEVAAEVAALLAYTAMKKNDKVGLVIFSDGVNHFVPPRKGRGHVWSIIKDILTYKPEQRRTDLQSTTDFLQKVIKHRSIVFVISDFFLQEDLESLRALRRRHDLICLPVLDQREREIPAVGFIELEDAETGESQLIDTRREEVRREFRQQGKKRWQKLKDFFVSANIDYILLETEKSYLDVIVRFFKQRERKIR